MCGEVLLRLGLLDLFFFTFLYELGFVAEDLFVVVLITHGFVELLVRQRGRTRSRLLHDGLVDHASSILKTLFLVMLCELTS